MNARSFALALLVVTCAACGKKSVPVVTADAAPTPIQCWRKTGIKPPGTRPDVARKLLEKGAMRVYLDPKAPGVVVPERHRNDIRTILLFGKALYVPIFDLHVDDTAISGTLTFDRQPFHCHVPWSAVFALTTDSEDAASGGVWEESVPAALLCKE